uniref:Uncharacterized protein n=1 Tax=Anguilla anguilla TaxID=7936 RepID=A0A0E9S4L1_ANGAN
MGSFIHQQFLLEPIPTLQQSSHRTDVSLAMSGGLQEFSQIEHTHRRTTESMSPVCMS